MLYGVGRSDAYKYLPKINFKNLGNDGILTDSAKHRALLYSGLKSPIPNEYNIGQVLTLPFGLLKPQILPKISHIHNYIHLCKQGI